MDLKAQSFCMTPNPIAIPWPMTKEPEPAILPFQPSKFPFALNIEGKSFTEIQKPRIEITKNILKEAGIIQ